MSSVGASAAMVGREDALADLHAALDRASEGAPQTVILAGEAGIGKTRLLDEFARDARMRADIHVGWCVDLGDAHTPYGPLIPVLRSLVALLGDEHGGEAVGTGVTALAALLPELAARTGEQGVSSPEGVRDAVAAVIETAAGRAPQVLVIEDLHWSDPSTLAMLTFLFRTLEHGRVLFVLSYRTDDVPRGEAVSRFLAEAIRVRRVSRLSLTRLDRDGIRAMTEQLRGEALTDEALEIMVERTEGVPFYVEELAAGATDPLPERLRGSLLNRFDLLSEDAQRVARVASGAQGTVAHEVLSALVGVPDDALDLALRECVTAGLLVAVDDAYRFRHALLREAVHDDLLPGERTRLHREYAQALESREVEPAAVASHWRLAKDHARALTASVAAMESARSRYAFASAVQFGERALELWEHVPEGEALVGIDRLTLARRLASHLRDAGDSERAVEVIDLALDEIESKAAVDPAVHARLLHDKAQYLSNLARPGAIDLLVEALALLDTGAADPQLRALVLNGLAGRLMVAGNLDDAISAATDAYDVAVIAGDRAQMSIARNLRGASRAHRGDVSGMMADFRAAVELAPTDGGSASLRYRVNFSDTLGLLGRYRDAVRVAEEGLQRAREVGVERSVGPIMLQNVVDPLLAMGQVAEAERRLGRTPGTTAVVNDQYVSATRVRLLAWRGRIEEAEALRRTLRPTMRQTAVAERQVWYYLLGMDFAIATAQGSWADAVRIVREMIDDPGPQLLHARRLLLDGAWAIAELRASGVDDLESRRAIRTAWDAVPGEVQDPAWAAALAALLDPTIAGMRAAVDADVDDNLPAVVHAALRLELTRLHLLDGRREEAGQSWKAADEIAAAIGHDRLQRSIRAVGAAAGLSAAVDDRAASDAGPSLTARESQVLDLIAEGLSNRQIGDRLFISAKTASVHVSAILRKLGVSTRTEAAVFGARAEHG